MKVTEFDEFKFYKTNIESGNVLVKLNGLWGIFSTESLRLIVKPTYNYLGLVNKMDDGVLQSDLYVAKKDNSYYLMNDLEDIKSPKFNNIIYDYNDKYIIIKNNNYEIYDMLGEELLPFTIKNQVFLTENYVGVLSENNFMIFKELNTKYISTFILNNKNNINVIEKEKSIEIYANNSLVKTIEL